MATCFLFAQQLDKEQCLCLRFDQNGRLEEPLAQRPIPEVITLQKKARTIVVLPTELSSLHDVELPWLSERKARAAIPYALEEQLAQNVTNLHFAFDRQHYQDKRYLVAVIDKQRLRDIISQLKALNLDFDIITLDWFALKSGEACLTESGLLVYDKTIKGALSLELAKIYLNAHPVGAEILEFTNSLPSLQNSSFKKMDSTAYEWIAQRLLKIKPINLSQGEFQGNSQEPSLRYWYLVSAVLGGLWLVSLIGVNAVHLFSLKHKIENLNQQIAVIYHEFFPQARQVISPKFRIGQFLKSSGAGREGSSLWRLLNQLSQFFKTDQFTIEQMRFQNELLSVTLISQDFESLEGLERGLQQAHVHVKQTQASTQDQKVIATLELSL